MKCLLSFVIVLVVGIACTNQVNAWPFHHRHVNISVGGGYYQQPMVAPVEAQYYVQPSYSVVTPQCYTMPVQQSYYTMPAYYSAPSYYTTPSYYTAPAYYSAGVNVNVNHRRFGWRRW